MKDVLCNSESLIHQWTVNDNFLIYIGNCPGRPDLLFLFLAARGDLEPARDRLPCHSLSCIGMRPQRSVSYNILSCPLQERTNWPNEAQYFLVFLFLAARGAAVGSNSPPRRLGHASGLWRQSSSCNLAWSHPGSPSGPVDEEKRKYNTSIFYQILKRRGKVSFLN